MMLQLVALLSSLTLTAAFVPASLRQQAAPLRMAEEVFDQEQFIAEGGEMRLKHLEEQAMFALKIACENYGVLRSCNCIGTWTVYTGDGGGQRGRTGLVRRRTLPRFDPAPSSYPICVMLSK